MRILFVASEVAPFAKTGGLGDVVGALPKALTRLGHDVRVIMPRYRAIDPKRWRLSLVSERQPVAVGMTARDASLFESRLLGSDVPIWFIEQPDLFGRNGLYQESGVDYPDNLERFSFLCQAVLRLLPPVKWQPDIVHCHDWQASLLLAHLVLTRAADPYWGAAARVLTIHNLAYQGLFDRADWPVTNLPPHAFGIDGLEFYGQINCLKGGIVFAEKLSTVSPTYATEIQTPEFGCGLDGVLRGRRQDLAGILNGIDPEEWNPSTDTHIAAKFSVDDLAGKAVCKLALQRQQRLPQRHVPLIGMVQRLADQKGIDIVLAVAEEMLAFDVQIVVLGTGEPSYHARLTELARRFPDRLAVNLAFDNALAHQIEAGSDMFLMPSKFEPCGLNQMYSMRYGSVPIVRRVGGLADTVVDVAPSTLQAGSATGFVFDAYSPAALLETVRRAVNVFRDRATWYAVVRNGMRQDFSWDRSARAYVALYEQALADKRRASAATSPVH